MKNKIFILGAILGSFMLGSCSDFLKEESQSEVIPKTASDFSELLLGTGYPDESTPSFSFLSLIYMADIAEINDMASERVHTRSVDDLQVFQ